MKETEAEVILCFEKPSGGKSLLKKPKRKNVVVERKPERNKDVAEETEAE